MKGTILFLAASISIPVLSKGQMIDASQVPQTVKAAFEKRYPGITPQWEYEEGKFDAEYKQDGKKIEILFDRQGNSAQKTDPSELPAAITGYIKSHYNDERIKKAKRLVTALGAISYLCFIKNKTLHFDADGKFLEEKPE